MSKLIEMKNKKKSFKWRIETEYKADKQILIKMRTNEPSFLQEAHIAI